MLHSSARLSLCARFSAFENVNSGSVIHRIGVNAHCVPVEVAWLQNLASRSLPVRVLRVHWQRKASHGPNRACRSSDPMDFLPFIKHCLQAAHLKFGRWRLSCKGARAGLKKSCCVESPERSLQTCAGESHLSREPFSRTGQNAVSTPLR